MGNQKNHKNKKNSCVFFYVIEYTSLDIGTPTHPVSPPVSPPGLMKVVLK